MMSRLSLLILLFVFLLTSDAGAQQQYNQTPGFLKANGVWATPDSICLNFNDPANFKFKAAMPQSHLNEGSATVADPQTGALLFYSDGMNCWDRNNTVMPNGSRLFGNSGISGGGRLSSTQGVCIVPFVNDPGKYYLFSLSSINDMFDMNPTKLYYSVVDMSLNNGLGDVVSTQKNIMIDSSLLSESMIAIPGDNCDIWLLTHSRDTAVFKAYHITGDGLDLNPVLSATGSALQGVTEASVGGGAFTFLQQAYLIGSMKVSPDRKKIAVTSTNIAYSGMFSSTPVYPSDLSVGTLLCDFNAATGAVSNSMLIDTFGGYDIAFSPDNSKFYIRSCYHMNQPYEVYQFDLSVMDSAAIVNSKIRVATIGGVIGFSSMKLYNDTIYVKNGIAIDRINSPNLPGAACNYEINAIAFSTGKMLSPGFPNDVVFSYGPDTVYRSLDTTICAKWESGVTLSPARSGSDYTYEWSDNSVADTLKVTTYGTYWVKYTNGCHSGVDTFMFTGAVLDPVISVNGFDLSTVQAYGTYQWMMDGAIIPNATDRTHRVSVNGRYQVIVSDGVCTDTSEVYEVTNTSVNGISAAAGISIYPNPAHDHLQIVSPVAVHVTISNMEGRVLLQSNAGTIDVSALAAGMYILSVIDNNNYLLKTDKLIKLK